MITLTIAIVVGAVLLAGIATLVVRLRGRVDALQAQIRVLDGVYNETVAQMTRLVEEAQDLSDALADQLAEQVEFGRSLDAKIEAKRQRGVETKGDDTAGPAKRTSSAKAPAATRSRPRKARDAEPSTVETARETVETTVDDMKAARQKGMDPLGVALQRNLQGKGGTWPSA